MLYQVELCTGNKDALLGEENKKIKKGTDTCESRQQPAREGCDTTHEIVAYLVCKNIYTPYLINARDVSSLLVYFLFLLSIFS
jgi:hypothetical protein